MNAIEHAPDGTRREWNGAAATVTAYDADGTITDTRPFTAQEEALYPATDDLLPGAPDLPTLAGQVTQLNDAVQMLILNALGV